MRQQSREPIVQSRVTRELGLIAMSESLQGRSIQLVALEHRGLPRGVSQELRFEAGVLLDAQAAHRVFGGRRQGPRGSRCRWRSPCPGG